VCLRTALVDASGAARVSTLCIVIESYNGARTDP
jgi:hypothetical protein